jgi:hypothetical protein
MYKWTQIQNRKLLFNYFLKRLRQIAGKNFVQENCDFFAESANFGGEQTHNIGPLASTAGLPDQKSKFG